MDVLWMPGSLRTELHLTSEDTAGQFCLMVDFPPSGWGLPPHLHSDHDETIYAVLGNYEMEIDGRPLMLAAGESVFIPRGVVHSGRNASGETGQRAIVYTPGGMEGFFREIGVSSEAADIDLASALDVAARYGWQFPV